MHCLYFCQFLLYTVLTFETLHYHWIPSLDTVLLIESSLSLGSVFTYLQTTAIWSRLDRSGVVFAGTPNMFAYLISLLSDMCKQLDHFILRLWCHRHHVTRTRLSAVYPLFQQRAMPCNQGNSLAIVQFLLLLFSRNAMS